MRVCGKVRQCTSTHESTCAWRARARIRGGWLAAGGPRTLAAIFEIALGTFNLFVVGQLSAGILSARRAGQTGYFCAQPWNTERWILHSDKR